MPPAPLPLLSCSWPCPPPPPQGRRPVCAEKGACALLLLHFPAPPPIRVPIPAFPAVRHSHPLLRSFIPPLFSSSPFFRSSTHSGPVFPRSPPCDIPIRPFTPGPDRQQGEKPATAPPEQQDKKIRPSRAGHYRVSICIPEKGRLHLAHTNALTQHNQSGAYPLINPCSHN